MDNLQSNQPTCVLYPLERRKIIKKTLKAIWGWLIGIFIWLALLIVLADPTSLVRSFGNPWIIWVVAQVFIALLTLLYQILYYKFYFYDLQDNQMIIRKGVIGRTEITTQYNRIQNVFVDQDIFDRVFGLYDVQLITAGIEVQTTQPLNHIDGVNRENAYILRDILLKKTQSTTEQRQGL